MKSQESLRYPIGKFEFGKIWSLEDTRRNIKAIARLPKELKKAVKKLKSGELDIPYRRGGWTARQVVHHLADSHLNAFARMKLAVTETTPIIKPYEEASWAETEDAKSAPVKLSIKILEPLHKRWVMFLESLSEEDLERGYFHPEQQRVISLPEAIAHYAWHGQHHIAHIRLVSAKKGKHREAESVLAPAPRAAARPRKQQLHASDQKSAAAAPAPAKRKRRSSAEVAAEKAAKAALPKLSRAEVLEKARAARAANLAEKAAAAPKKTGAAAPAKRKRRSSAEVAAEKAAKAALPKLSRAEVLEKARAARAANLAEKAAAAPKKAKAAPSSGDAPRKRGLSPERMAEIRAMRGKKK
ncbi:MAG: putative metal-dependent hydrolase [Saprospiraceae bacterium]|nr:putative metal-dependent hydrolase [Saprospiraceae bacterium]